MKLPGVAAGALLLAGGALLLSQNPREVCLGDFSTSLKGRTKNQTHNAILSMSKLRKVKVAPGESISFNKVVGTYTVDAGYRKAPVSYNGTLLDGWGGGVCQTSTTVYNAALLSGMEIVKRGRHRFAPLYAPPGRDAAVAYPYIDLVIRNPFPHTVELRGNWSHSRLEAGFFAEKRSGLKPQIETHIVDQQNPSSLVLASVGNTGRLRNSGKKAFEVITYRITGNVRERISHDSYPAMHRYVEYR